MEQEEVVNMIRFIIENIPDNIVDYIKDNLGYEWVEDPEKLIFAILSLFGIIDIRIRKDGKYTYVFRTGKLIRSLQVSLKYVIYKKLVKYYWDIIKSKYNVSGSNPKVLGYYKGLAFKLAKNKLREIFGDKTMKSMQQSIEFMYILTKYNLL